jgi:hypothetical protein
LPAEFLAFLAKVEGDPSGENLAAAEKFNADLADFVLRKAQTAYSQPMTQVSQNHICLN